MTAKRSIQYPIITIRNSNRRIGRFSSSINRGSSRSSSGGVTTILVVSNHSVLIRTRLIQVNGNCIQVLTRNLNTILEPNVGERLSSSRKSS